MSRITIVGLGPGDLKDISLGTLEQMKNSEHVYLRTQQHPVVAHLKGMGIHYKSFDWVYDEYQDFQSVYARIVQELLSLAQEGEEIVYGVPGNPLVAEETVERLLKMNTEDSSFQIDILPAISFIDAMIHVLKIDPIHGLKIVDGLQLANQGCDSKTGNIITQVYSPLVASDIKLQLMEYYKEDTMIWVIRAAGVKGEEQVITIPLFELDRLPWVDYLTSIYIPPVKEEELSGGQIERLLDIMDKLRSEDGCPWDQEQDHQSLRQHLIEEAYEVLDAINRNEMMDLEEELGDLLLQIVFHAQIAKEKADFDFSDVVKGICDKLVYRHPHIFSDIKVASSDDVMANWEELKKTEKGMASQSEVLKAIPNSLPALMRAYKVQKKAADVGFDWEDIQGALSKVQEEWNELITELIRPKFPASVDGGNSRVTKSNMDSTNFQWGSNPPLKEVSFGEVYLEGNRERIIEEFGDLLFSIVNVSRFLKIQPELALGQTIEKFLCRFSYMEEDSLKIGKNLGEMTLKELDQLWNQSKNI